MGGKLKQNISLIIGLAIPFLMIVFVAAAIYFPRWFSTVAPPKYDFLYAVGYGRGDVQYLVRQGKLVKEQIRSPQQGYPPYRVGLEIKFFIHRVKTNRSEEVTFDDAAKLDLDSRIKAPDGYSVVHGRRSTEFFPFFASWDYKSRYLKKDSHTEKLNIEIGEDYSYSFRFLGWIVE